jgi:transcriptional/translational regulatory protein YebC/TACO1
MDDARDANMPADNIKKAFKEAQENFPVSYEELCL